MTTWTKVRVGARLLLLQARWDPARMQGTGFCFAIEPWLAVCWAGEPERLREARQRHLEYFNTNPIAAWLLAGIVCRGEAAAAAAGGAERERSIERVRAVKASLGASLAGLYDSFFWGALRPASAVAGVLAVIAASRAAAPHALAWGAATALVVYNAPAWAARWLGLKRGFDSGEKAVVELVRLPLQAWISGLRRAAAGGALAAFALGSSGLPAGQRLTGVLVFVAGVALSWRGLAPLWQVALACVAGSAAAAAGIWP